MRPSNFLTSLALFTAVTSAWPSGWDPLGTKGAARIRARQNDNNNDNGDDTTTFDLSVSTRQGNTATTEESSDGDSNTRSGENDNNSNTDDSTSTNTRNNNNNDDDATSTGTRGNSDDNKTKSGDKTENKSTETFDARMPAGGVQMVTPDIMDGAKYYKIKDHVTFGFNFTSLSITPSAVDILASCSLNSATYTIAQNHSVTAGNDSVQAVTWDTGEYQATASTPLLLATYTLIIHDAAKDIDATPSPGYLGTWEQFTFGMYTPQPYTPLNDYVCATCNDAMSSVEKQTYGFLFGMVVMTVLSFSWFAGVAGLW